jgi:hypothetical protein
VRRDSAEAGVLGRYDPSSVSARPDGVLVLLLAALVFCSRAPFFLVASHIGKDTPLYLAALRLDRGYAVPMPGNLGYVLLGKIGVQAGLSPTTAFAIASTALEAIGIAFVFLLARRAMSRGLSLAVAVAMSCSTLVWYHGPVVTSYPVWLAALPAIGFFGWRFLEGRRTADAVAASVSLGIGSMLRPDMLLFGGPLLMTALLLGRARPRQWLLATAIVGACTAAWFAAISTILGGSSVYLGRVAEQARYVQSVGVDRGWVDGGLRNAAKYAVFLAWTTHLAAVPAFLALVDRLTRPSRATLFALAWLAPSLLFSLFQFMGTAGLVFPLVPLVYIAAAWKLERALGQRIAAARLLGIALVNTGQFLITPLLPDTNQRNVILNVTFGKYTAAGLRNRYPFNLSDFGVDESLSNVLRQLRAPRPVPKTPLAAP